MSKDFLLEIHCEEIPAKFLAPLHLELQDKLIQLFEGKGLVGRGTCPRSPDWYSPRKIAVFLPGIHEIQPDTQSLEVGPSKSICLDSLGQPTDAGLRFADKWKSNFGEIVYEEVKGKKGDYAVLRRAVKGLPAVEVLSETLPALIASLSVPKAMRWGHSSFVFVRPIRNILCLLGTTVVPFEVDTVKSSSTTLGHRLSPGPIEVTQPSEYESKLANHHVIVSCIARRTLLQKDLTAAASSINGNLISDESLLRGVSEIVEYPSVILGQFSPEFLTLPQSILTCSLREHQKSFCIQNSDGKLLPYFLSIANRDLSQDHKARETITKGNEWVLNARLFDAKFFYNEDTKTSLESRRSRLEQLTFIRGAGTYLQKTERLSTLAGHFAPLFSVDPLEARLVAHLSKLDLTTQMVVEFPELQGKMGSDYLRNEGLPESVCKAIEEHYAPVSAEGSLPSTPLGSLLAVIDKLDTLVAAFAIGQIPTGSKDPLGLRRAGSGLVRILKNQNIPLSPVEAIHQSLNIFINQFTVKDIEKVEPALKVFWDERMAFALSQDGFEQQLLRSVMAAPWHDHLQLIMRCQALKRVIVRADFGQLIENAKRINNILVDQKIANPLMYDLLETPSEKKLLEKSHLIDGLMGNDQLDAFCLALAELAEPLEEFFKEVMVLDKDINIRKQRLNLLFKLRSQFDYIADFSKW